MKKTILTILFKAFFLILTPLILTCAITGIHKEPVPAMEQTSYVQIYSTAASQTVEKSEYILGVTAGLLGDWDYEAAGTSELAKMYGVLTNTYMTLKSQSALVMNADDFDLNYINPDLRKKLWGDRYAQQEKMLSTWLSEVSNLVIKSDGKVITPYFHSLSAGATRKGPFSYLVNADTSRDLENTDFLHVIEMSADEFYAVFTEKHPESLLSPDSPANTLQIISRDEAGYVTKLQVGSITLSGEEFADILGLPSPSFTITFFDKNLKIITKGIGHGYGVSLNHAAYLAEKQYPYDTILGYFYDNIEITSE